MSRHRSPETGEQEYARFIRREAQRAISGERNLALDPYLREGEVRVPQGRHERALLAGIFLAAGSGERALEAVSVPGFHPSREWLSKDALIIDPGFVRLDGHHANTNEYYRRLLERLGFQTAVLRNIRSAGNAMDEEHGYRVFAPTAYMQPFGSTPTLEQLLLINDLFHLEFRRTLGPARPRVMVAHTLRSSFVEGFCRFLAERFRDADLKLVLGAVETDALDEAHPLNRPVREIYRRALDHLKSLRNAGILFIVERPELRRLIRDAGGAGFEVFESPFVGAGLVPRQRRPAPSSRAPVIGFVGQTRIERGVTLLPRVIERTLEAFPQCRWVVQLDLGLLRNWGEEASLAAFETLAGHAQVDLVSPGLPSGEYQRVLSEIDILVLPYGERYRYSGSGIALEGLRAGQVQVVPESSSMAAVIRDSGGEPVTFPRLEPAAVATAVAEAIRRFDRLSRINGLAAARLDEEPEAARVISTMIAKQPLD